jgi:hypothetical protein
MIAARDCFVCVRMRKILNCILALGVGRDDCFGLAGRIKGGLRRQRRLLVGLGRLLVGGSRRRSTGACILALGVRRDRDNCVGLAGRTQGGLRRQRRVSEGSLLGEVAKGAPEPASWFLELEETDTIASSLMGESKEAFGDGSLLGEVAKGAPELLEFKESDLISLLISSQALSTVFN